MQKICRADPGKPVKYKSLSAIQAESPSVTSLHSQLLGCKAAKGHPRSPASSVLPLGISTVSMPRSAAEDARDDAHAQVRSCQKKKRSVNTCMRRQCMRIGLHSQSQYNQQYLPPADGSEHMRSDIRLLAHGLPPLERLLDGSLLDILQLPFVHLAVAPINE